MITNTKQGQVEGISKLGCLQFRGIPFAAPPTGELRWRAPQPPASWAGVRDATEYGPTCPQIVGAMEAMGGARRPVLPMDEDCLTLNVFTESVDGSRPVMVWIHGGAFSTGSGRVPWYSGHNFVRDGVVVVTINYRLNAFGFLRLDGLFDGYEGTGTLGIQDQIAALRWVRDNIANFGGDPSNVTIFGESAGGMSVGTLLASPEAKGLFAKAIPQSGAAHNAHTAENAEKAARTFLEVVGVEPGDNAALQALTTADIVKGLEDVGQRGAGEAGMLWQPAIGDETNPVAPIDALRNGVASDIPVLIGTNLDEWNLFTIAVGDDVPVDRLQRPVRTLFDRAGRSLDDALAVYKKKSEDASDLAVHNAVETDRIFRIPAVRLAEAQASVRAPVWMYRFDWPSSAFGGRMGAAHALEIAFVFDNLDAPGADLFTGPDAPQELADEMHAAWVSFAKDGDPGWQRYDAERRPTMVFNRTSRVEEDPDGDTRILWEDVL